MIGLSCHCLCRRLFQGSILLERLVLRFHVPSFLIDCGNPVTVQSGIASHEYSTNLNILHGLYLANGTKYHVYLSKEDRQELENLIRSGESLVRRQTRARILLLTDENQKKKKRAEEIASVLMCSLPTITAIRRKFIKGD